MTSEERRELIRQYEDGYAAVERSLAEFPTESLTARPLAGKWSACEIVQHLADSEMRAAIRLRQLLTEENAQIQGYDEAAYAVRLRYNERTDIRPALDAIRGARHTSTQIIAHMTDQDWARSGQHPEHGNYTAEDWLRIYAAHALNHAAQIDRLREALSD